MSELVSCPFGPFDPLVPRKMPGLFSSLLAAEPVRIHAPVSAVWEIVAGFEAYPLWNPLNRYFDVDGDPRVGARVTFGPSWGPYDGTRLPEPSRVQREVITVWEPGRCLGYAVVRPWLKAERIQALRPIDADTTEYRTYARFQGILEPLVRWFYAARVAAGFRANALALAERAEAPGAHP